MSTNMGDIAVAEPDGATKKVLDLDDHQRDHRNANKVTWGVEHSVATVNEAGKHMFPVVTDAQEAALTDNPTGRVVINTTKIMLRYYTGSAWADVVGAAFASGVRMVFDQDAAPTGWTRDTSYNDKVIRIVSGARSDGGSWTISGLSADNESAHTHTGPSHTHTIATNGTVAPETANASTVIKISGTLGSYTMGLGGASQNVAADYTNSGGTGATGAGSAHGHTISVGSSWRPLHRDMIVASKD